MSDTETKNKENLLELKKKKRNAKAQMTKIQSNLHGLLCKEDTQVIDIQKWVDELILVQEEVINILLALCELDEDKFEPELETVQKDTSTTELMNKAAGYISSRKEKPLSDSSNSSKDSSNKADQEVGTEEVKDTANDDENLKSYSVNKDLWGQLKRVTIPNFNGNKKDYPVFKDAFYECIDKASCSSSYKMLQLRQCLNGEALRSIEGFPASDAGYNAAKRRLEEKFGGDRRFILLHLDALRQMKPVASNDLKGLESFCDKLELAIVALEEKGRTEEFQCDSMFYCVAKSKLPSAMVANYKRWLSMEKNEENLSSLREWTTSEVRVRVEAREEVEGFEGKADNSKNADYRRTKTFVTLDGEAKPKIPCKVCDGNHPVWSCLDFKAMSIPQRWEIAKHKGLCFRCLGATHKGFQCRNARQCNTNGCSKTHHSLLHGGGDRANQHRENRNSDQSVVTTSASNPPELLSATANPYSVPSTTAPQVPFDAPSVTAHMHNASQMDYNNIIAMRIIPVILQNRGRHMTVNALLDECSTDSYIDENVAAELGITGNFTSLNVSVVGGKTQNLQSMKVSFDLLSTDRKTLRTLDAFTVRNVTGNMPVIDWSRYQSNWPHLQGIDFPKVSKQPKVALLIGLNVPDIHRSLTEISGLPGEPIARLTPLGWTCIGPISPGPYRSTHFARTYFIQNSDADTNTLLQKMWDIESIKVSKEALLNTSEKEAVMSTDRTRKFIGNRYEVGIPWKTGEPKLTDNQEMAESRLINLEKSLRRRPEIAIEYEKQITDQERKGYIRQIPPNEDRPTQVWYLPHFAVVRQDKATTKVRVVMDAAAKFDGKSLNDCIHPGPKLQQELFEVLIRFRSNQIAIAADIAEMFLQIELAPADRKFHRFLWRNMDNNSPIREYEFNRLVFGNSSSPYLAQDIIRYHIKAHQQTYPLAAESILNSMYVDDLMDSVNSIQKGISLRREISEILAGAGFKIRKWISNSAEVLADIPVEDRATSLSLDGNLPSIKTLGVLWNAETDNFTFKVDSPDRNTLTKRFVLHKTASLFDPMNFLAPFTIRAKIGIQQAWVKGLGWDDELPPELSKDWQNWFRELSDLCTIQIPRCLVPNQSLVTNKSIHTFVDASEKAYAAVCYLRCEHTDRSVIAVMIAAKARVAPLKAISIPKLELCGALLGLRLSRNICDVLNIPPNSVTYWSDSQNVLYWIKGESRTYKPFVAHRVGEIQEGSCPDQWRHVPTKQNSADLATRGMTVEDLAQSTLWWHGPDFLLNDRTAWPECPVSTPMEALEEIRKPEEKLTFITQPVVLEKLDPEHYSSWNRLLRVTAWINRFCNNARRASPRRIKGCTLTVSELQEARNIWYRKAQTDCFSEDVCNLEKKQPISNKSRLLSFNPYLDEQGIVRVNGRLAQAEHLAYDARFPIILPRKHAITRLITQHYHELGNHNAGTSHTLADLRTRFWIIHGREVVKEIESKCTWCKRHKAKPAQQVMAPLPKTRLGLPLRAFARVGIDYAGPIFTKQGRSKARMKRYLCLFTCLATRAVHLEMAWGLDTDSFLCAFDRFVNRRGKPIHVLSDNGLNFVGANKELKTMLAQMDQRKIAGSLATKGIQWQFNPPLAPHFGGVFEALIKSAKRAIKAILGEADVTDEELLTAIVGAEGLINSRPLCYQGDSVDDEPVLTPNHFLHGQLGGQLAPEQLDLDYQPKKRWVHVQTLIQHVWRRWIREFLPMLNARKKWNIANEDLKVGDIALVMDPQTPRGKWPLGRIIETFPGNDGHVRVVKVQIGQSTYTRPIHRLCPLET
jgi:hypothetical protein